jgi:hypothetical protein
MLVKKRNQFRAKRLDVGVKSQLHNTPVVTGVRGRPVDQDFRPPRDSLL